MFTRELAISVDADRICVGIYWYPSATACHRVSGTVFHAWPRVLALVARFRAEFPDGLIVVRAGM